MYLHNGNIKAYEVPLSPNAYTAGRIKILMGRWILNGDLILDQNTERKPDCMIKPIHRPRLPAAQATDYTGVPYSTMVAFLTFIEQQLSTFMHEPQFRLC